MLEERLGKIWRERLAGTVFVPADDRGEVKVEGREPRLVVLLAAAHRRAPTASSLTHIRRAAQRWNAGEPDLAAIHLALSGLGRLREPRADAWRLFLADGLLEAGLAADALLQALDLGASATVALAKYNPDQPRVAAGSGRTSGEWTSTGAAAQVSPPPRRARPIAAERRGGAWQGPKPQASASRAPTPAVRPPVARRASGTIGAGLPASFAGAAVAIGRPAAGIDLEGMSEGALSRLAVFLAGLEGASAIGTAAGLSAGLGVLFFPSFGPTGKWTKVGGPGNISYFRSPDVPGLTIRYTTADGVQHEWRGAPDPNGEFRGPDGQVIARLIKTGAKVGLVLSTAALLGSDQEGPKLCPAPEKDRGGALGQKYENFVKALFNPGNPTPPGLAYKFFNSKTGQSPMIDDCQQKSGILAEYKGPGYAKHLLKDDFVWENMEVKLLSQAYNQVEAKGARPLIWFIDEKPLADYLEKEFKKRDLPIDVDWLPMPRRN